MLKYLKTRNLLMLMTLLISHINSYANSTSEQISITANVEPSCTISNGASASLGNYSLISDVDSSATISVTCTNGVEYQIGLNSGQNSSDINARSAMFFTGTEQVVLIYQLYQDEGYSQIWGNTVGTDAKSAEGTGIPQTHTIFTRIFANQPIPPVVGVYEDYVTITVSYQ